MTAPKEDTMTAPKEDTMTAPKEDTMTTPKRPRTPTTPRAPTVAALEAAHDAAVEAAMSAAKVWLSVGNTEHTETCNYCGSSREVVSNGCHSEESPWVWDSLARSDGCARPPLGWSCGSTGHATAPKETP